jgi:hypothetical protein
MLTPLAPALWEIDATLRVFGLAIGHRMTVARLPDGSLWLHAPVAYSAPLAAALAELGPVGHIVAPDGRRNIFLEDWFKAYPQARTYTDEAFAATRPDLKFTDVLTDAPPAAWSGAFSQHILRGLPEFNEILFLHHASHSLILTDLSFDPAAELPFLARARLWLRNGGKLGSSHCSDTLIEDRATLCQSLSRVLSWDFDRVIVSRGRNIEVAARDTFHAAFAFL